MLSIYIYGQQINLNLYVIINLKGFGPNHKEVLKESTDLSHW